GRRSCCGGAARSALFFLSSRGRHTSAKRDWSSDVCSSALWPDTLLQLVTPPRGPEIVTVTGPEPSLHWKRFCDEVLEQLQLLDVSSVISLGALLADSPHSRPLPVSAHVEPVPAQPVEGSDLYSGPIGVPTILARRTASAGLRTTSIWVQVPHYVSQNTSPKAVLGLMREVQDHVSAPIPLEELVEDAEAWERG